MTQTIVLKGGPLSGTIITGVEHDTNGLIFEGSYASSDLIYRRTERFEVVPYQPQTRSLIQGGFYTVPVFEVDWRAFRATGKLEMVL